VTGGVVPKFVGMLGMSLIDPLTPPGGKAPISAAKNALRLKSLSNATGSLRKLRNLDKINALKKAEQLKLDDFRKTPKGIGLLEDSHELFKKQGNLEGLEGIDEFIVRKKNAVNYEKRTGLSVASQNIRDLEAAKRAISTDIPRSSVVALAENYGQPKEIVDLFLSQQKAGKKILTDRVAKINKNLKQRFKDNPEFAAAYQKKLKASLGHVQAADTFDEAADILSNLELENFFVNARRAHNNELPGELSRALGASRNLNEEFLKFIDPQLGNFWKELRGPQKRRFRNLVQNEGMDVNEALEKVGFGKPRPVNGLSIKKTKLQWDDTAQTAFKQMKAGNLPEARWRKSNIEFTWAPKDLGGKGRGYIDVIKDVAGDDDYFALQKQFFEKIKTLPSGTEWTLEADTAQKYRLYKRMFRDDPRITPGGDTELLKKRGIDHFVLRIP